MRAAPIRNSEAIAQELEAQERYASYKARKATDKSEARAWAREAGQCARKARLAREEV